MSLYAKLKFSSEQLKKFAREREAISPISFSLMGKYQKPKSSSDKCDKKDEGTFAKKFKIPLNNLDNKSDKYKEKVKIFSDGKQFDWCEFCENTDDLFDAFGCTSPSQDATNKRHHLYFALFAGRAKSLYIAYYNKINSTNVAKPSEEQSNDCDILKLVINETAKSFFHSWDTAIQEQKQYMRQNLFLGDTIPLVFIEQLKCMNKFLKYFPRAADISLAEDKILIEEEKLITIIHHALHGIMQLQIQQSGNTINEFQTPDALKVFFDQQHECDVLEKRLLHEDDNKKSDKKKWGQNHKKSKKNDNNDEDKANKGDKKPPAKPKCNAHMWQNWPSRQQLLDP
jgi:hypothetical protein